MSKKEEIMKINVERLEDADFYHKRTCKPKTDTIFVSFSNESKDILLYENKNCIKINFACVLCLFQLNKYDINSYYVFEIRLGILVNSSPNPLSHKTIDFKLYNSFYKYHFEVSIAIVGCFYRPPIRNNKQNELSKHKLACIPLKRLTNKSYSRIDIIKIKNSSCIELCIYVTCVPGSMITISDFNSKFIDSDVFESKGYWS